MICKTLKQLVKIEIYTNDAEIKQMLYNGMILKSIFNFL